MKIEQSQNMNRKHAGLRTGAHTGLVESLGTIFRRITEIRLSVFREGIPADMFAANCLPYKASKSYRAIKTELEHKRAKAQSYMRVHALV